MFFQMKLPLCHKAGKGSEDHCAECNEFKPYVPYSARYADTWWLT